MTESRPSETDAVHDNHGNSTAAWASVIVIMLGALIGCIAVLMDNTPVFVVGIVVVAVGAALGKILSALGYGVAGRSGRQ